MSQYKTGTASVTNGSATVTGTGTLWASNVTAGDGFTVAGSGVTYTVGSVDSDTQITLSAPYAGATASGQSYAITRDFTANYDIPELSQGDIETATVWTRGVRKIDSAISGIVPAHEAKADPHPQYAELAGGASANFTAPPRSAGSQIYARNSILGTVSQSAGVPTGAIIERGSNSNGEYVKFADGTLICSNTTIREGNGSNKISFSQPLPTAYINALSWGGVATAKPGSLTPALDKSRVPVGTSVWGTVELFFDTVVASGEGIDVRLLAIGRWF